MRILQDVRDACKLGGRRGERGTLAGAGSGALCARKCVKGHALIGTQGVKRGAYAVAGVAFLQAHNLRVAEQLCKLVGSALVGEAEAHGRGGRAAARHGNGRAGQHAAYALHGAAQKLVVVHQHVCAPDACGQRAVGFQAAGDGAGGAVERGHAVGAQVILLVGQHARFFPLVGEVVGLLAHIAVRALEKARHLAQPLALDAAGFHVFEQHGVLGRRGKACCVA